MVCCSCALATSSCCCVGSGFSAKNSPWPRQEGPRGTQLLLGGAGWKPTHSNCRGSCARRGWAPCSQSLRRGPPVDRCSGPERGTVCHQEENTAAPAAAGAPQPVSTLLQPAPCVPEVPGLETRHQLPLFRAPGIQLLLQHTLRVPLLPHAGRGLLPRPHGRLRLHVSLRGRPYDQACHRSTLTLAQLLGFLGSLFFLGQALMAMLVYVWSRRSPRGLPWATSTTSWRMSSPISLEARGSC
ncbi:derlin-3 isoform X1 [Piliocolobus tephrosceles]|uniref:derlin-3 isoform X1 n=1 Tax=Piliocolobus tephrosceles TaxID=591936 RepID=UPI001300FEAA|nr:derlin-3 isoform X1 [Piliocolobus tephrosceles]